MSEWFEGQGQIRCGLEEVQQGLESPGETFVGVIRHMPGLTTVELVEEAPGSVTIRTDEGLMTRSNIVARRVEESLVLEYDERYDAGKRVSVTSHYLEEFTPDQVGVRHRLVISGVEAPGFLGYFYRHFGSSSIGKATLAAYRTHFEAA